MRIYCVLSSRVLNPMFPWKTLCLGAVLVLVTSLGMGCSSQAPEASYKQKVLQHRMQRDMNLRDKNSVLSPAARKQFKGLHYFPVDSTYRFRVPLERTASPETVRMRQSTGGMVTKAKVGSVTIPFPQGRAQLSVFRVSGQEDLWIPFADSTNRTSTYPAGRYVDAEVLDDSLVLIDFNMAYNPSCDYNPRYTCPFPPRDNRIAFGVPAGEKRSGLHSY